MNVHEDIYRKATKNDGPGALNLLRAEDLLRSLLSLSVIQYDDSEGNKIYFTSLQVSGHLSLTRCT